MYSLFCCEVDKDWRVVQMYGDNKFYGLSEWFIGKDLSDHDFLLGMPLDESWIMRDMNVTPDNHADIYFAPNSRGKRYLIFISTQGSIARRRENQQRGNDLTLLHEQNKKLISQLEIQQQKMSDESMSKSHFIAGMSHEFRTPLTSIIGYTQLISEQAGLSRDSQVYLDAVERSSQHLMSLVENLLDQAQFDTDDFKLLRINVSLEDMINEVTMVVAPLAATKALSFSADITPRCSRFAYLDNVRVRQILINLLGNAVKFTDDGEVSLIVDEADGHLVFMVADTGPGIEEKDREKIFAAFSRLKEKSNKPGVGLGLSISKKLVQRMEGTIEISSTVGEGTTFTVKLPFMRADEDYVFQQTQPMTVITPADHVRVKTILLAEDNPDISNLLKIILMRSGYDVTIAENGELALAFAQAKDFDVILSDVQMPVMNGLDFVKLFRKEDKEKPVIALTASNKVSEKKEMFEAGFSDLVTKPVKMDELLDKLERISVPKRASPDSFN